MSVLIEKNNQTLLHIRLTPNANTEDIVGIEADEYGQQFLKIRIRAVPEKGKANKALIAYIAKKTRIPKSKISLISGDTQRKKVLKIDLPFAEAQQNLASILNP
ncbi:MAG: DUF167 family protein [Alphaproteobacteria bacterium]